MSRAAAFLSHGDNHKREAIPKVLPFKAAAGGDGEEGESG